MSKAQVVREAEKQGIEYDLSEDGIVFIGDGAEVAFIRSYGIPLAMVWQDAMDWLAKQ